MCSIFGILNFNGLKQQGQFDSAFLHKINKALLHRGPDDSGTYLDNYLGFAHNRLSIQDLSAAGHQPMFSSCGNYVIAYNGEVYNHIELRQRFLPVDAFKGHSDTETIIELFSLFMNKGMLFPSLLTELNGMFAIAIWDIRRQRLFLARDRMGIKPIYVYSKGPILSFSSEIKAFNVAGFDMEIRPQGMADYFTYGHSSFPNTIYRNVKKFQPGTWQIIEKETIKEGKFWSLYSNYKMFTGSYGDAVSQLRELVADSIQKRLISDVPFGAFLSGGVDSSAITYFMQKYHGSSVNTFSVGFDAEGFNDPFSGNKYSELQDARSISNKYGSIHHELVLKPDDLKQNLDKLVYHYDEPFGDSAALPTLMICQLARQFITVCHSGDGADELFGGYRRYRAHLFCENHPFLSQLFLFGYDKIKPILTRTRRLHKIASAFKETNPVARYSRWLETMDASGFAEMTGSEMRINSEYDRAYRTCKGDTGKFMLLADQGTLLVDGYLEKIDKASMANSLEVRVPYLDYRLVDFSNSLPVHWKINKSGKRIFKDALKGIVPDSILNKSKRGFTVPLDEWFQNELSGFLKERLLDASVDYAAYGLNRKVIERYLKEHLELEQDQSYFLWQVLVFNTWIRAQ